MSSKNLTIFLQLVKARVCWDTSSTGCFNAFVWISPRRLSRYQQFKDFQRRILVATNLFGRGMDIERVNIVFNYDMPEDSDTYLHRVWMQPCAWMFQSSEGSRLTLSRPILRWLVLVASAPRVWPSHLCQMKRMPKSWMMCRTGLRSMWLSYLRRLTFPLTVSLRSCAFWAWWNEPWLKSASKFNATWALWWINNRNIGGHCGW